MNTATTNTTTKTPNPRRLELVQLSKVVQPLIKTGQFEGVNEAIKKLFYEGVQLNTFKGWLEKGKAVKKGEKAKVLWGTPRRIKDKEATEEEKGTEFFPICYVFSIDQVEDVKPKNM